LNKPRVLIVDDDELIAVSLCRWLSANDCECDVAFDSRTAHEHMALRLYDLILVDPYLTGGFANSIAELRATQPAAALIVATAYATPEVREAVAFAQIPLVEKPQPVPVLGNLVISILGTQIEAHVPPMRRRES
jgi:DNA-binding NtrC family response regulator